MNSLRTWFRRAFNAPRKSTFRKARLSVETLEDRTVPTTFLVTNTNDSGLGSLRQAILNADNTAATATNHNSIQFAIGTGAQVIAPQSPLPAITVDYTDILGNSQPGFSGTPLIQLSGQKITAYPSNGLELDANNCTIHGLVINQFASAGVYMWYASNDTITGDYIGTNVTGSQALGNSSGIYMFYSYDNQIGGTTAADRNVISANRGDGIYLWESGRTVIEGNRIGTDVTGSRPLTNGYNYQQVGVDIEANSSYNQIGGYLPGAGNVISGNWRGVQIGGSGSSDNELTGNFIGTDATGTKPVGNLKEGVLVEYANSNSIGGGLLLVNGHVYYQGNVISANGDTGVTLYKAESNTVESNKIGTDVSGTKALGNGSDGVYISDGSYNVIGGSAPGESNEISANVSNGVHIFADVLGPSIGNQVQSNEIGTDQTGILHLGNHQNGVYLQGDPSATTGSYGNQIGGADTTGSVPAGVGNTIAFNTLNGVLMQGNMMVSNPIRGNAIYGNGAAGISTYEGWLEYVQLFQPVSSARGIQGVVVNQSLSVEYVNVDLYASSSTDAPGGGVQGRRYLGSVFVVAVPGANYFTLPATFAKGEVISATVTDYSYSITSEFESPMVAL